MTHSEIVSMVFEYLRKYENPPKDLYITKEELEIIENGYIKILPGYTKYLGMNVWIADKTRVS